MKRAGAFTLLEVLVGLAILGMAVAVLGSAYVNMLEAHRALGSAGQDWTVLRLLQVRLLAEADRQKLEQEGQMELPDGRRLAWRAEVRETPVPDLFEIEVVWGVDGWRSPTNRCRFRLVRPSWSAPVLRQRLREEWQERQPEVAR